MQQPIKAFLSYARADHEIAAEMGRHLGTIGIEISTTDHLHTGADWGDHLRKAMASADAVIFVATPAGFESAYVMSEVGAAIASGKTVIPVVTTSKGMPAGMPAPLRHWNFVRTGKRDRMDVALEIRDGLQQSPAAAA